MKLCEIEGGAQQTRFVGGAGALAERWAAALGVVTTGAPVRRIEQNGDDLIVTSDRGALAARRAVITVPPPLVDRIELVPAAPVRRAQLLQRCAMGALVKVIVAYERAFWRDRELSGEAVALRPQPVAVTFDNCLPERAALVAFVQAEPARRWAGDTSCVLDALARWFGDEARHPVAVATTDWSAEVWSRGCPTAVIGPRALTSIGATLREPVGRVHFAGTETATEWTGYIEGALESGERAAREVIRAL
jgi:monoamine oxidase